RGDIDVRRTVAPVAGTTRTIGVGAAGGATVDRAEAVHLRGKVSRHDAGTVGEGFDHRVPGNAHVGECGIDGHGHLVAGRAVEEGGVSADSDIAASWCEKVLEGIHAEDAAERLHHPEWWAAGNGGGGKAARKGR